jgi:hypothetical protein
MAERKWASSQNPYLLACPSPYASSLLEKYAAGEKQCPSWQDAARAARPAKVEGASLVGQTMSLFAPMSKVAVKAERLPGGRILRDGNTQLVDPLRSPQKKPATGAGVMTSSLAPAKTTMLT